MRGQGWIVGPRGMVHCYVLDRRMVVLIIFNFRCPLICLHLGRAVKVLVRGVDTHGISEAPFVRRSYLSRNRTIGSSVRCICSPSVVLLDCSRMLLSRPLSLMFPSHGPRECTYILLTYAFFCRAIQTQICLQEYIPVHMWLSSMKVTPGCVHVQLRFV